jgi:endonuclease/exonuclease/phosphatase family metal-dependent hydrolase
VKRLIYVILFTILGLLFLWIFLIFSIQLYLGTHKPNPIRPDYFPEILIAPEQAKEIDYRHINRKQDIYSLSFIKDEPYPFKQTIKNMHQHLESHGCRQLKYSLLNPQIPATHDPFGLGKLDVRFVEDWLDENDNNISIIYILLLKPERIDKSKIQDVSVIDANDYDYNKIYVNMFFLGQKSWVQPSISKYRELHPEEFTKLNWGDKKETITASTASTIITVLSFNIAGDSRDWQTRKSACYDVINTLKPDIIGFQELLPANLKWALENFPHLSWYGQTIEGNSQAFPADVEGESCRILYDKNRFTVDTADSGAFWFSPTPGVSSEGWDDFRYCVYVRLVDQKTGDGIYLYNTHWAFGSDGQDSRTNAARILTDRITGRAHPETPFIVTGDFNATNSDEGIQILLQNMSAVVEHRIDWIFAQTDKYELLTSEIISDINGTAISDHDVLSAELKIKR